MLGLASNQQKVNYSDEVIQLMRKFYHSLSEKDRRRYAAVEASKIGHGGISYIAKVLGCSRDTIKVGRDQLERLSAADLNASSIRRQGAGRKRVVETMTGIEEAFQQIMDTHIQSGHKVRLSQRKMASLLADKGYKVSITVVKQLIQKYESH